MTTANSNGIVASSKVILDILERLKTVALSDSTVLLIGETGVGKEIFAEYLHAHSVRRFKPLVKIGVATLPSELVETELFGHEKGAFTSANSEKKGLFEVANGGTLFLDDIDDLPMEIQPKLLRAMESREVQRVGSTRCLPVDVRFVAATKVNLKEMVDRGTFRADLFYRLNVVPIRIPPLRERREDIPLIVEHYLKVLAPDRAIAMSREAMRHLVDYSWPGNVRELKNIVDRLVIFAQHEINSEDLPVEIKGGDPIRLLIQSCSHCFESGEMNFNEVIECLEIHLLQTALEQYKGNKSKAAEFLSMKLSTFRDKLAKYNLAC